VNRKSRGLEKNVETFEFEGNRNTIKIFPDIRKIKRQRKLYTITLSGLNRSLRVMRGRKNEVILNENRITAYLTAGSRADFKLREETTGDKFILTVNHLGSPFIIRMKVEENIYAQVEVDKEAKPLPPKRGKIPQKKTRPKSRPIQSPIIKDLKPGEEGRM